MNLERKKWNDGNLELSGVAMKRARAATEGSVAATVERVSAMLPGLFVARGGQTHWFTMHHDHSRYGAVHLKPERAIGRLEIELAAQGDDATQLRLELVYTSLTAKGNELFEGDVEGRLMRLLERILAALRGEEVPYAQLRLPGAGPRAKGTDAFRPATAGATHEMVVNADADDAFALACPVAELEWIDDWHFDLVYSDSGVNEDDCIFLEPFTGLAVLRTPGKNTHWYTTRYDKQTRRFDAALVTADFIIGRWAVEMDDLGNGQTLIRWSLTYSGLTERGNRIIDEPGFEQRVRTMLRFLASSAKHYSETGEIWRLPVKRKAKIALSLLDAAVTRHVRSGWSAVSAAHGH